MMMMMMMMMMITPPKKTNMDPQNDSFQKESAFFFQGSMWDFGGVDDD